MKDCTGEQIASLRALQVRHGRNWKAHLRAVWESGYPRGDDEAICYALRNSHGPAWLIRFRFTK